MVDWRRQAGLASASDLLYQRSARGASGRRLVIRSTDPIDFIPRPAPVAHVREAYGLVITGESMVPEYKPGETALINPLLPVMGGEVHVFYSDLQGEARATIKHLRRATATEWLVTSTTRRRASRRISRCRARNGTPRTGCRQAREVVGREARRDGARLPILPSLISVKTPSQL